MNVKLFALFVLLYTSQFIQAQSNTTVQEPSKQEQIYTYVDQMPHFQDGAMTLSRYIKIHLRYPQAALDRAQQGTVFVRFVVDAEGNVRNPVVTKGVSPELDEEALRVVCSFPKWVPGRQNGRAVSVYYNLPVRFRLE